MLITANAVFFTWEFFQFFTKLRKLVYKFFIYWGEFLELICLIYTVGRIYDECSVIP